jgi:2-(1,2-epoxy-1,2-dihydrophenyl)acetyl-CoA isomerase
MNAFDRSLHEALSKAWFTAADPAVRCVVLTGEGRGFCAGADLQQALQPQDFGHNTLRHTFHPHMLAMAALDKPVIAAVNGAAAGAGLSLACAADLRLASTSAKFVPAFVDIGLVPDAGGTYYVTRLLGYSKAFAWLAGGERWSAEQALNAGLVNDVLAPQALLPRALELAAALAAQPGAAVGLTKTLLARAARASLAEQLEAEAEAQTLALRAPGRAEARTRKLSELIPQRT